MRKILFGLFIALTMLVVGCDSAPDSGQTNNNTSGNADSGAVAAAFKRSHQYCVKNHFLGCAALTVTGVTVEGYCREEGISPSGILRLNSWPKAMLKAELPVRSFFVIHDVAGAVVPND